MIQDSGLIENSPAFESFKLKFETTTITPQMTATIDMNQQKTLQLAEDSSKPKPSQILKNFPPDTSLKDDIKETYEILKHNENYYKNHNSDTPQIQDQTLKLFQNMEDKFEGQAFYHLQDMPDAFHAGSDHQQALDRITGIDQNQHAQDGFGLSLDYENTDYTYTDLPVNQNLRGSFYDVLDTWEDPLMIEDEASIPVYTGSFEGWDFKGEKAFHRLLTIDEEEIDNSEILGHLRRLKQISRLVAYFRGSFRRVARLFAYGCWCLPRGGALFNIGRGDPVDEIDHQCYQMGRCEACLQMDFGLACDPITKGYTFEAIGGPGNGLNTEINCLDAIGTCSRSICECDKNLARNVHAHLEDTYSRKYSNKEDPVRHAFEENCVALDRSMEKLTPDACCGEYPNRFPFDSLKGNKACCGGKTFLLDYFTCCNSNIVALDFTCV